MPRTFLGKTFNIQKELSQQDKAHLAKNEENIKKWKRLIAEGQPGNWEDQIQKAKADTAYYLTGKGAQEKYRDWQFRVAGEIAPKLGITARQLITNPQLATDKRALAEYTGKPYGGVDYTPGSPDWYKLHPEEALPKKTAVRAAITAPGQQGRLTDIQRQVQAAAGSVSALQERIRKEGITGAGGKVLLAPAAPQTQTAETKTIEQGQNILDNLFASLQKGGKGEIPLAETPYKLPEKPAAINRETQFEELRTEYGIDPLENELTDLENQEADLLSLYERAKVKEEERLAPMAIIRRRQAALSQEQQIELDRIQRRKQVLVNQLNNKYNTINMIMNFKKQDYDTARREYEFEYNKNYQLVQQLEANKTKDEQTAKSIWQTAMNALQGTDYNELSADSRLKLKKLELSAGLPAGISELALKKGTTAKKQTYHIVSPDKSQILTYYDDGSFDIKRTGFQEKTSERVFWTKTDYKNLAGQGISREAADTISAALQEGLSLEAIRRALAEEYGREKGYHYLDVIMPYIQKLKPQTSSNYGY